jgi:Na+/H+ antiporter family
MFVWLFLQILFPLICLPTYQIANGDPIIFYSTVAGILSGAVAGDHCSPISDTTVLASLASDCKLLAHVATQAPYAGVVIIASILFGTLPIGNASWPNIVGILLGVVALAIFVFLFCVPIMSPTGRWDPFTLLYLKYKGLSCDLHVLQADCIAACNAQQNGEVETEKNGGDVIPEESDVEGNKNDGYEPANLNEVTA